MTNQEMIEDFSRSLDQMTPEKRFAFLVFCHRADRWMGFQLGIGFTIIAVIAGFLFYKILGS